MRIVEVEGQARVKSRGGFEDLIVRVIVATRQESQYAVRGAGRATHRRERVRRHSLRSGERKRAPDLANQLAYRLGHRSGLTSASVAFLGRCSSGGTN